MRPWEQNESTYIEIKVPQKKYYKGQALEAQESMCTDEWVLPVLPTFHTAVPHKTTSPQLYHRADMPQSEKDRQKKRGNKGKELQRGDKKKKKKNRNNTVRVSERAAACSYQRDSEWKADREEKEKPRNWEGKSTNKSSEEGERLQSNNSQPLWKYIVSLPRRINGCLHKRINAQGFHSKVYNIKDRHSFSFLSCLLLFHKPNKLKITFSLSPNLIGLWGLSTEIHTFVFVPIYKAKTMKWWYFAF